MKNIVGDVFILTDPDLQFNPNLPENFIQKLISVSDYYQAGRVGFALLIDAEDIRTDITYAGYTIKEWESRFWEYKYKDYNPDPQLELYAAPIDTTFCLFNRKYDVKSTTQVRVAGNYTCMHIPWHINFKVGLAPDEYEAYLLDNISTNWFGPKTKS